MQQITSAITGVLDQVEARHSSTGPARGETASGPLSTINESEARAWLVAREPEAVDKALSTSLRSSLGVNVVIDRQLRFPVEGGYYSEAVGCELGGETGNFPEARERVNVAMTPLTKDQAEKWLAALQATTAGRRGSETGQQLALEFYSGALMRYPADVAVAVCRRMATRAAKGTNWFPTLSEIVELGDRLSRSRRLMADALGRSAI